MLHYWQELKNPYYILLLFGLSCFAINKDTIPSIKRNVNKRKSSILLIRVSRKTDANHPAAILTNKSESISSHVTDIRISISLVIIVSAVKNIIAVSGQLHSPTIDVNL